MFMDECCKNTNDNNTIIATTRRFPCFPGLRVALPVGQGYLYTHANGASVYLVQPGKICEDVREGTFLDRKGCEKPNKINGRLTYKYDA